MLPPHLNCKRQLLLSVVITQAAQEIVKVTKDNHKEIFGTFRLKVPKCHGSLSNPPFSDVSKRCSTDSHEIVFLNFYADWCPFSQMLAPVFSEAFAEIRKEFPENVVLFARVDCDKEGRFAEQ
jgi:thiol-disulfide isomerase/thioredoxin